MNVANILKVADAIEQASVPGLGFNLSNYVYPTDDDYPDRSGRECGTCACVAGWACAVIDGAVPRSQTVETRDHHGEAALFLGLDSKTAHALFLPSSNSAYEATPVNAARALRILAITGKVDWTAAMDPSDPVLPPLPASKALTVRPVEA